MKSDKGRSRLRESLILALIGGLVLAGCSRSPEAREARYMAAGRKRLEQKDYARAILEFRNAVKAKSTDAEAYYQLGLAHLGAGDVRAAVTHLLKAAELNPKHLAAQIKLAEMMDSSGNRVVLAEAEKRAQGALVSAPGNADALNALAIAEWKLGDEKSAQEHLEEAFAKFPQNLKAAVSLAKVKLARKDIAGAEEVLKKTAAQNPPSGAAVRALGAFYLTNGKPAEAERQFSRAAEMEPKNGAALMDLANTQFQLGKRDEAEKTFRRASELPEKRYKPVHPIYLYRTGKRDQAVVEFEKLVSADPADRDMRSKLVAAYVTVNRPADAEKILNAALRKNAKDTDALLQLSAILLTSGRYAESQKDLTQLLQLRPDSARGHYLMAGVYQVRGAVQSEKQELNEALKRDRRLLAARIEMAKLLIASNSAKAALDLLNAAPPPRTVGWLAQKNWALLAIGDREEARKGIDSALKAGPLPDFILQNATLKLLEKNYAGARSDCESVLRTHPADLRALNLLVRSYVAQNQMTTAVEKVREHAAANPALASVHQFLGETLLSTGDRAGARTAFSAAAADPRFAPAQVLLAEMDAGEGKLEEARKRVESVLAAAPASVQAHFVLAQIQEKANHLPEAMEEYRKVLGISPDNITALNNLAYLLGDSGNQDDEALKYAARARQLAPDNPAVADTLGWLYYRKGLYKLAVPHLETAVSKAGNARREFHLAMAYLKSGDEYKGVDAMQAGLKMDAAIPEAKMAQQVMAQVMNRSSRR